MEKLVIGYTCTKPTIGGAELITKTLVENLNKNYNVTYIGYNGYQNKIKCRDKIYPFTHFFDSIPIKSGLGRLMRSSRFIKRLLIKKIDLSCDIFISNSTDDDLLLDGNAIKYKALIAIKHHPNEYSMPYIKNLIINKPFKIVALNKTDFNYISKIYGSENTKLIYNGIPYKNKENATHNKIFKKKNEILIFSICRLEDTQKKLSYAIKAIKDIIKFYPNLKYIIAGAGPDKNRYVKLIKRLHLEKKVILAGFVSDTQKGALLKEGDIAIYPSVTEGFSMSILESLRAGKIVISGKNAGAIDIIKHNKNGFLTDLNVNSISTVLLRALKMNENEIKKLKKNAKLTIKRFTVESMIKKYIYIINELSTKTSKDTSDRT